MGTWQKNRCPRCGGRVFADSDMDGWYEQCINCSYRNELQASVDMGEKTATKNVPSKV